MKDVKHSTSEDLARWRVGVVELSDVRQRRDRQLPNVFVFVYNASLETQIERAIKPHPTARDAFVGVRKDLGVNSLFGTHERAQQRRDTIARKLARAGFTVNPSADANYSVYVLELKPKTPGVIRLYVGQTSKSVDERIADHLRGHKASRPVTRSFVRRRPTLEPKRTYSSLWDAEAEETALGKRLLARGFDVVGPQWLKPRKNRLQQSRPSD